MADDIAAGRAEFSATVRARRSKLGLSQADVGKALADHGGASVSGSAVGEWERGDSFPTLENALALERVFVLDTGVLLGLLGYAAPKVVPADRMDEFDQRLARVEEMIEELVNRRRRRGAR